MRSPIQPHPAETLRWSANGTPAVLMRLYLLLYATCPRDALVAREEDRVRDNSGKGENRVHQMRNSVPKVPYWKMGPEGSSKCATPGREACMRSEECIYSVGRARPLVSLLRFLKPFLFASTR